jgi:hypothetical protein
VYFLEELARKISILRRRYFLILVERAGFSCAPAREMRAWL